MSHKGESRSDQSTTHDQCSCLVEPLSRSRCSVFKVQGFGRVGEVFPIYLETLPSIIFEGKLKSFCVSVLFLTEK